MNPAGQLDILQCATLGRILDKLRPENFFRQELSMICALRKRTKLCNTVRERKTFRLRPVSNAAVAMVIRSILYPLDGLVSLLIICCYEGKISEVYSVKRMKDYLSLLTLFLHLMAVKYF